MYDILNFVAENHLVRGALIAPMVLLVFYLWSVRGHQKARRARILYRPTKAERAIREDVAGLHNKYDDIIERLGTEHNANVWNQHEVAKLKRSVDTVHRIVAEQGRNLIEVRTVLSKQGFGELAATTDETPTEQVAFEEIRNHIKEEAKTAILDRVEETLEKFHAHTWEQMLVDCFCRIMSDASEQAYMTQCAREGVRELNKRTESKRASINVMGAEGTVEEIEVAGVKLKKRGGLKCPSCGDDNFRGTRNNCVCNVCGHKWKPAEGAV